MHHLKHLAQIPPREFALSAAALTLVLGTVIWSLRDYQDFLALGPGGAPYNVKGWAWVTSLRPYALSKRGALDVSSYPTDGAHEEIKNLPDRSGVRASVGGIIPHRQLSQHPSEEMNQVRIPGENLLAWLRPTKLPPSLSRTCSRTSFDKIATS
jgi:hypothetical protein